MLLWLVGFFSTSIIISKSCVSQSYNNISVKLCHFLLKVIVLLRIQWSNKEFHGARFKKYNLMGAEWCLIENNSSLTYGVPNVISRKGGTYVNTCSALQAEFIACLNALEWAQANQFQDVLMLTDSANLVSIFAGYSSLGPSHKIRGPVLN